jgi:hypothetical protein
MATKITRDFLIHVLPACRLLTDNKAVQRHVTAYDKAQEASAGLIEALAEYAPWATFDSVKDAFVEHETIDGKEVKPGEHGKPSGALAKADYAEARKAFRLNREAMNAAKATLIAFDSEQNGSSVEKAWPAAVIASSVKDALAGSLKGRASLAAIVAYAVHILLTDKVKASDGTTYTIGSFPSVEDAVTTFLTEEMQNGRADNEKGRGNGWFLIPAVVAPPKLPVPVSEHTQVGQVSPELAKAIAEDKARRTTKRAS